MIAASLGFLLLQQARPALAVVTRAQGQGEPVLGRRLAEGYLVSLQQGQSRTVLHLSTGSRIALSGPTVYVVQPQGLTYRSGQRGKQLTPVKKVVKPIRERKGRDGAKTVTRPGAVVVRGGSDTDPGPHSVAPTGGLLPSETSLRWKGSMNGDAVVVSFVLKRKEVASITLKPREKECQIPLVACTPGEVYTATITVLREGRFVSSDRVIYKFLPKESVDELAALEDAFLEPALAGDAESLLLLLDAYAELRTVARAEAVISAVGKAELTEDERARVEDLIEELRSMPTRSEDSASGS